MKNLKTKIIVLASLVATLGAFGVSHAANAYISASPTKLTRNVGNSFTVSVNIIPDGANVYAVDGTIVFSNLECKNITIAEGLIAPFTPSCSNPYFLIGIPKGTVVDMALFTILVNGNSAGTATITFDPVDIMGDAGQSISNLSVGGAYQIEVPKPVSVIVSTTPATSSEEVATTSPEVVPAITINTDNKSNGFIATVLESLSNILPSTKFTLSAIFLALVVLALGPSLLKKSEDQI